MALLIVNGYFEIGYLNFQDFFIALFQKQRVSRIYCVRETNLTKN